MLEIAVIGEQEQSFAILIETAHRIHAGNRYKFFQRRRCVAGFVGELAEHSIRLVEEDVAQAISVMLRMGETSAPLFRYRD